MTRSELATRLWEAHPGLARRSIEAIVDAIFDGITAALVRGDRVELRDFGTFTVRRRTARTGRNPRTGGSVQVAEKYVPFFKVGKGLHDRLNRIAHQQATAKDDPPTFQA